MGVGEGEGVVGVGVGMVEVAGAVIVVDEKTEEVGGVFRLVASR